MCFTPFKEMQNSVSEGCHYELGNLPSLCTLVVI